MAHPSPEPGSWNAPEQVERFAAREADRRLVELLPGYPDPAGVKVLDLGCAGGRNTELLARAGFDVHARDLAPAMVARTRERVAGVLGAQEATRRVRVAAMDGLADLADGSFDLIVALGIYHQAQDEAEWGRALDETARVAACRARILVANFAPGTGPVGAPLARVPGTKRVYEGLGRGHLCLLGPEALDADFAERGFEPEVPSTLVEREADGRLRVTVNALYRRVVGR